MQKPIWLVKAGANNTTKAMELLKILLPDPRARWLPLPDGREFQLRQYDPPGIALDFRTPDSSAERGMTDAATAAPSCASHNEDITLSYRVRSWKRFSAMCRTIFCDQYEKQRDTKPRDRKYEHTIKLPAGWRLHLSICGNEIRLTFAPYRPSKVRPSKSLKTLADEMDLDLAWS